jgi:hypothetical protein
MVLAKYTRTGNQPCDICESFKGRIFDLDSENRPVTPSEGRGFTTTHPHCGCIWGEVAKSITKADSMLDSMKEYIQRIHRKIGQRARRGTLHRILPNGKVSKRTTKRNPRK